MKKIMLLSPHLDDAVFSVGGVMAALADEGHALHVVTCFTRSVPNPTGFALACQLDKGLSAETDYMRLRRQEDALACELLGAQPHWIDLPEAPHRGYQSAAALFGDFVTEDVIQPELTEQVRAMVARLQPDLILSPVGIGHHVDHRQVVQTVEKLREEISDGLFLRWYDEPYLARNPAACPVSIQTEQRPRWEVLYQQATDPKGLPVPLDADAHADQKLEACSAYATQVGFQFGGAAAIREVLSPRGRLIELLV